jgi:negative regulator of sigma E activity
MTSITDEDLTAYADNELPEARRRDVAEALQHDDTLRQRYQRIAEAGNLARQAYAQLANEPAPAYLRQIVETAAIEEPHQQARPRYPDRGPGRARSVAASLAHWLWRPLPAMGGGAVTGALAGVLAAVLITADQGDRPAGLDTSGQIPPDSPIHEALQTVQSGEIFQEGQTQVAPVATFQTGDTTVCREYQARLSDRPGPLAGVACRSEDGRWFNEAVIWLADDGTYRTAEGDSALRRLHPSWRNAEPLSPEAERRVLRGSGR